MAELPDFIPPRVVKASGVGLSLTPWQYLQLSMFCTAEAGRIQKGIAAGDPAALRRKFLTTTFDAPVGELRRQLDKLDGTPRKERWLE